MPNSNYLEGLVFRPHGEERIEETRSGVPVFDGTPHRFEAWKIRVEAKVAAALACETQYQEKEMAQLGSKIIDGLSGDAQLVARDFGVSNLMKLEGPEKLIIKMRDELMGNTREEARELHDIGSQRGKGPLQRQRGESMTSYVTRRRRWYERILELNSEFKIK